MIERYHPVQVDGEEVRLRYTIGGLRAAQAASGKPISQLLSGLLAFDLDACTQLLRAARVWTAPEMTDADAEALLQRWVDSGADLADISRALLITAEASGVLKPQPVEKSDPNAKRRATPRKSGSAKQTGGARASGSRRSK